MKYSWRAASRFALVAVIALAVIVPGLKAGPPAGKFNLPFDAKWGSVALPAGDYTFSLTSFAAHGTILVYRQGQPLGFVRPQLFERKQDSGNDSKLVCIRHDGNVTVRELRIDRGTFYFEVPKESKTLEAQETQKDETISIQVRGE